MINDEQRTPAIQNAIAYAKWFDAMILAHDANDDSRMFDDLRDAYDMVGAMLSFIPSPRSFVDR